MNDVTYQLPHQVAFNIHNLTPYDDGEVYDLTQEDEVIKDGDILILAPLNGEPRYAILCQAWPTIVYGQSKILHSLVNTTWFEFEKGKYAPQASLIFGLIANQYGLDKI